MCLRKLLVTVIVQVVDSTGGSDTERLWIKHKLSISKGCGFSVLVLTANSSKTDASGDHFLSASLDRARTSTDHIFFVSGL